MLRVRGSRKTQFQLEPRGCKLTSFTKKRKTERKEKLYTGGRNHEDSWRLTNGEQLDGKDKEGDRCIVVSKDWEVKSDTQIHKHLMIKNLVSPSRLSQTCPSKMMEGRI